MKQMNIMRDANRISKLQAVILAIVVLGLSSRYLGAQTPGVQKNGSETQAVETEIAAKKKDGGKVTIAAVNGSGVAGHIARWLDSNTLESSVISQDANKIGIGTTTPTSKLTVNGKIESLAGGFKFPDGTIQDTAGIITVAHGATLTGDGTSSFPLGIPLPLSLQGAQPSSANQLVAITETGNGRALTARSLNGGVGIVGQTDFGTGIGVLGYAQAGDGTGVAGQSTGAGSGVDGSSSSGFGVAASSVSGTGVWARGFNPGSLAGDFLGDVHISGTLTKGGGSFKIDHPLDPATKYLSHSFVESPDMMNIYNGNVTLDSNGEAVVDLPDWYGALNRDARYLLTAIGAPGPSLYIAQKITNNRFRIAGGQPGMEVSWQVTGIRQDAWANKHRIPVEEQKSDIERGHYLHPELFNQPEGKGVEWARNPELMQRMKQELVQLKQRKQER